MEQHEKEIMGKIRRQMEDNEIPEGLRPDAIEETLMRRQKKDRRKRYRYALTAAACFGALGIVYMQMGESEVGKIKPVNPMTDGGVESIHSIAEEEAKRDGLQIAKSYEEVYQFVKGPHHYEHYEEEFGAEVEEKAASGSVVEEGARAEGSYSKTNTREENVDEGDTVKTDGRYLYVVKEEGNEIGIVDTAGNKLEQIADITLEKNISVSEIYVQDSYLIVLGTESESAYYEVGDSWLKVAHDQAGVGRANTRSVVYDISDKENPKMLGENWQSGNYNTSRIHDGYLYVFSQYHIYNPEEGREEEYIPCVNGELLASERIYVPGTEKADFYMVVTAVDIKNPGEEKESVGILSNGGLTYVSEEHIYICDNIWSKAHNSTAVRKLSYREGEITGVAKTEVKGHLNDSFSIDEHDGYLRMVTTVYATNSNSVYVLDEKLNLTGKIENLAKDERIYSARFMGETGYFVTFREVDPLFSVDLSDPKQPKIIGELKIPGFSEYLHPYGEGLLLGIGAEVDEKGVEANNVKLSMFDISDPSNVKEIDKTVLGECYYSTAFDEYKSVLADAEKNMIGFYAFGEEENYYIYTYDKEQGFVRRMKEMTRGYVENIRGVYIENTFYLINGSQIESYQIGTYEKIDDIVL